MESAAFDDKYAIVIMITNNLASIVLPSIIGTIIFTMLSLKFALINSIMESIDIGANALKAHGLRMDIHAKNIANIDTPNYVRKIPILNATEDLSFRGVLTQMKNDVFGTGTLPYLQGGVVFNGVVEDPTMGERLYMPGHPDADANGYIRSSNVNAMVDMADAVMAQRAYEANLAVINITKAMASRATEIGK